MEIDPAATAWLLACTALVLLMTPGLAIFYGGMVRSTGVLNMIMMCFISIPVVTIAWLLAGYSLAFGQDAGGGLIGNLDHVGLLGIDPTTVRSNIPELLFLTFQLGFAIVTAALVCGAIADRARFSAWMIYVAVWTVAIYAPVAHWVVGTRRLACIVGHRRLRGRPRRRDRVRCVCTGIWRLCSVRESDSSPRRCGRTIFRSSCSASDCCGSGGSASTRARRSPRTERRPWCFSTR